jgi:ElaB/YqjD/DUF883 family membrane-anchored ribosome-binding protein
MNKKDEIWHDQELKKLKEEKKEILGEKIDDSQGSSSDVSNRKRIKEEFKKERRRIKRSEKQNWKKQIDTELNDPNNYI